MENERDCLKWRDLNQMFHNLFYEPADRPLTLDVLARLRRKTDRYIRIHLASMRDESQRQHKEILNAVEARNCEAAIAALTAHLAYTSNDLQSCMRLEHPRTGADSRGLSVGRGDAWLWRVVPRLGRPSALAKMEKTRRHLRPRQEISSRRLEESRREGDKRERRMPVKRRFS